MAFHFGPSRLLSTCFVGRSSFRRPNSSFREVSQNALNLAFTNNAAGPEHRVVANGFAVTSETVGTLGTFTVEANGRCTWKLVGLWKTRCKLQAASAWGSRPVAGFHCRFRVRT